MKVRLLSSSDGVGGAARAAFRLYKSLRKLGSDQVDVRFQVLRKITSDCSVLAPISKLAKGWPYVRNALGGSLQSLQKTANASLHSSSWLPGTLADKLNSCSDQLLHMHWIQEEMLSIEAIGRLRKPLIWTLHDCWAFSGSEHYPNGLDDFRYVEGYFAKNRPAWNRGIDLDRWCWQRKRRHWLNPIHLICPSNWLASCVSQSALMAAWPISVIPNAIPVHLYTPWPKLLARRIFDLPSSSNLILFGAMHGGHDPRKGWDLLEHALGILISTQPNIVAVVFGQDEPLLPPRLGLPIRYVGHLADDQSLAMLYSACDVMVVPSRIDNLPQTATELRAVGCQ